jgi:hypothetical protein
MPLPPRRFADYTPRDPGPTAPVLDVPRHRWPAAWDALTTARVAFACLPDPDGRRLIRTTPDGALILRRDFDAQPVESDQVPAPPRDPLAFERGELGRLSDTPRDPALARDPDPPPPRRPARRTKRTAGRRRRPA